jgi:hypothetical protein
MESPGEGLSKVWPISEHPDGVVLSIKAQPGAKKNEVRLEKNGQIKVCVTQRPEKGKANRAVLNTLADFLDVRESRLELLSGETSQHKRVLILNCSLEELTNKLKKACCEENDD